MVIYKTVYSAVELPDSEETCYGVKWNPQKDVWILISASQKHYLSFENYKNIVTQRFLSAMKMVFVHYLKKYSIAHANNLLDRLRAFLVASYDGVLIDEISDGMILAYRSTLTERTEWYLGSITGLLKTWSSLQVPGVNNKCIALLKKIKNKGNIKGEAVLTMNPETGPLSDIEFQAIINKLNSSFSDGEIDFNEFVVVWLFLALGSRPIQLAELKMIDLSVTRGKDGATIYLLNVPRAKQRGVGPRSRFKVKKLVPEIGMIIEKFIENSKQKWEHLGLPDKAMPMFVNPKNVDASPDLKFHCTGDNLSVLVESVFEKLAVQSERTGGPIKISTRRFRYTCGTRAAMEGASELVIAELLDHNDTQNVGIYVQNVPEIIERIDKAMAMHLAPMAQAFAGQLIENERQAKRGRDPRSRIVSPNNLEHPIGSCGSFGFCGAFAPIACYTCRNFQPWIDGPHQEILEYLVAKREMVRTETQDLTIASINDRTILACAEVVLRCEHYGQGKVGV